jgi:hypothetical protein
MKLGEADLMFRKHFYRGVLQCVLEERFAEQRPGGGGGGGGGGGAAAQTAASPSSPGAADAAGAGDEGVRAQRSAEAVGGPPAEALQQGNREIGWVVGAQKKVAAAAAADAAVTEAEAEGASPAPAVGDAATTNAAASASSSAAASKHPNRPNGAGKSWDQVVNSKVRAGSFAGYAGAALQRLGLEAAAAANVTELDLEDYERRHSHRRQQIAVIHVLIFCHAELRVCVAFFLQCVLCIR